LSTVNEVAERKRHDRRHRTSRRHHPRSRRSRTKKNRHLWDFSSWHLDPRHRRLHPQTRPTLANLSTGAALPCTELRSVRPCPHNRSTSGFPLALLLPFLIPLFVLFAYAAHHPQHLR